MRHWVKTLLIVPVAGLMLVSATPANAGDWRWGARAADRIEDRLDRLENRIDRRTNHGRWDRIEDRLDRREDRFDRRHGPRASYHSSRFERRLDRKERRWQRRAYRRAHNRGWWHH